MRQDSCPHAGGRLVSSLCTQAQHESPTFRWWVEQIREKHCLHRKQWEFAFIAQALTERGMLAPGRRGLGFAVGKEPLPALFASHGCEIVATDLDAASAKSRGWVDTNQHAQQLGDLNDRGICPSDEFAERVSFRVVDMNSIPDDLTGFDFVWSSCSFEHLGSISKGMRFIDRMTRCLKPGGVAVHTTEFNLSSNYLTLFWGQSVIFRRRDIEGMMVRLRRQGHHVELSLDRGDGPADKIVDRWPYTQLPHLKLRLRGFVSTSLGLIIEIGENEQGQSNAPASRRGRALWQRLRHWHNLDETPCRP